MRSSFPGGAAELLWKVIGLLHKYAIGLTNK